MLQVIDARSYGRLLVRTSRRLRGNPGTARRRRGLHPATRERPSASAFRVCPAGLAGTIQEPAMVPGRAHARRAGGHRRLPPAAEHDLQAWPISHGKRDSTEARLSIVSTDLAVFRWIEERTGWPIHKFVRAVRHYRAIQIQVGQHTTSPLPDDLRQALDTVTCRGTDLCTTELEMAESSSG